MSYYGYGPHEGVCYDGPHEGESYKQEREWFRVAIYPKMVAAFDPNDIIDPFIRTAEYRWSRPLRKWVFQP